MTDNELDLRIARRMAYDARKALKQSALALRTYRRARGLTTVRAAAESGLSRMTINRIENGKDVRMHLLVAVLDWMGKPEC